MLKELNDEINQRLAMTSTYEEGITILREMLDSITSDLIDLCVKRAIIVKNVGELKKKFNKPLIAKSREEEIMKRIDELVEKKNIELRNVIGEDFDPAIIKRLLRDLIDYALRLESGTKSLKNKQATK